MIEQGTLEWYALRCGKVTASRVADIVRTTKTGISASRQRYLGELVAERLTGVHAEGFKSADMQWGKDTEAQARDAYAFYRCPELEAAAFVDHPTIAMSGCSPDRLVSSTGLLEIKCTATHTHIQTLLGGAIEPDYIKQMQWQMACTGRLWCDWVSFDPRMPEDLRLHVRRVPRVNDAIALLEAAVRDFLSDVDAAVASLRALQAEQIAAE